MASHKPREERRVVFVTCRLRDDGGWSDMTICNLSAHGLMARCSVPPPRGAFVEVRKGGVTIVGQVRWVNGSRIEIRTQDRIDVLSLLEERAASIEGAKNDRRSPSRDRAATPVSPAPAEVAERSRQWSRLFDWLIVAAVGIVSAAVLAAQVYAVFDAPLRQVGAALDP